MDIKTLLAIEAWRALNKANDNNRLRRQRALEKAIKGLNFKQREEFEEYQREGTP